MDKIHYVSKACEKHTRLHYKCPPNCTDRKFVKTRNKRAHKRKRGDTSCNYHFALKQRCLFTCTMRKRNTNNLEKELDAVFFLAYIGTATETAFKKTIRQFEDPKYKQYLALRCMGLPRSIASKPDQFYDLQKQLDFRYPHSVSASVGVPPSPQYGLLQRVPIELSPQ